MNGVFTCQPISCRPPSSLQVCRSTFKLVVGAAPAAKAAEASKHCADVLRGRGLSGMMVRWKAVAKGSVRSGEAALVNGTVSAGSEGEGHASIASFFTLFLTAVLAGRLSMDVHGVILVSSLRVRDVDESSDVCVWFVLILLESLAPLPVCGWRSTALLCRSCCDERWPEDCDGRAAL